LLKFRHRGRLNSHTTAQLAGIAVAAFQAAAAVVVAAILADSNMTGFAD